MLSARSVLLVLFCLTVDPFTALSQPLEFSSIQSLDQDVAGVEESVEANDRFGDSLAAGDFNGDGYQDLAVGVPREDFGGTADAGAVQVFYGSPEGLDPVSDQIWTQDSPGIESAANPDEQFGFSLAAGDFNRDGYADLAVGVPSDQVGRFPFVTSGAVNVLYGSASGLTSTANQIWSQSSAGVQGTAEDNDAFGWSLATGDFNGDGYADLAIGVPDETLIDPVYSTDGVVHVIFGSAAGLTAGGNQLWSQDSAGILDLTEKGDRFGASLASGDFNGDGFDDLAVGVPNEGIAGAMRAGLVHIIPGSGAGLTSTGNLVLHQDLLEVEDNAGAFNTFGFSLTANDFNGDGFDDLAVGVPGESAGGNDSAGAVALFHGSSGGLTTDDDLLLFQEDLQVVNLVSGQQDFFGITLASGDTEGHGAAWLFAGCPYKDTAGSADTGHVAEIYWKPWVKDTPYAKWEIVEQSNLHEPHEAQDRFGIALAAGDFDGDGLTDLAVGARESFPGADLAGAVDIQLTGRTRLVFPYVASWGGWETEICGIRYDSQVVSDPDPSASCLLQAYDGNGTLLGATTFPIGIYSLSTGKERVRHAALVSSFFPEIASRVRYCALVAPFHMTGYTKFSLPGVMRAAVPASSELPSGDLLLPHVANSDTWWVGLGLVNAPGLDRSRTLRFNAGQTPTVSMQGGGQSTLNIADLLPPDATNIETAVLEDAPGLHALELFGSGAMLAGVRVTDQTATTLYYPHVAPGNGQWWTGLVAYNPGTATNTLTITAYAGDGTVVDIETDKLDPGDKLLQSVQGLGFPATTAWVKIEGTQPLTGLELFGTADGNQLAGFNVIDISHNYGVLPKLDQEGWTGIALVNTLASPISVLLYAGDDSATSLANATVALAGHAKLLGTPDQIFPGQDVSQATFVVFFASGPVAAFQLNGSTDGMMLDALPALSR